MENIAPDRNLCIETIVALVNTLRKFTHLDKAHKTEGLGLSQMERLRCFVFTEIRVLCLLFELLANRNHKGRGLASLRKHAFRPRYNHVNRDS